MILYGGYCARPAQAQLVQNEQADALHHADPAGLGQGESGLPPGLHLAVHAGRNPEQIQWFNELQRITTSPDNAVRIAGDGQVDISDLLPQVRMPTLVLHCRDDAAVPFDEGRRLAAGIPGARFVALEGRNHVVLEGDPSWGRFLEEIKSFLRQ